MRTTILASLLLTACAVAPAAYTPDGADDDPSKEDGTDVRQIVTYKGNGVIDLDTPGLVNLAAVEGPAVADLEAGRLYELRMTKTTKQQNGLAVYDVLSYRKQITLVGSPSPDGSGVAFHTVNGNTWLLTGSLAAKLLSTDRFEAPAYDPASMLYVIQALEAADHEHARVVSRDLASTYDCKLALPNYPQPVELEMSAFTADRALDLFEWTTQAAGELQPIAWGTCHPGYTCDLIQQAGAYATFSFAPPQAAFDISLQRTNDAMTQLPFHCTITPYDDYRAQSEG